MASAQESAESQLENEQYLQPKSRHPITSSEMTSMSSNASGSISPTPQKVFWTTGSSVMTSDGSCAPQNQHNWNQELLRYVAANGGMPPSDITGDTQSSIYSNTRYSTDPLKMMIIGKEYDVNSEGFDPSKSQAQVGGLKLELPLDEDDYLLPTPQQNQPATAYVDLIGESKHVDGMPSTSGYRVYPDFLPPHAGQTNIDNPEYIMSQESNSVPCQTIGIPTSPTENIVQSGHPVVEAVNTNGVGAKAAGQPPYHPQRSSEEESDHEYYNDFDRLRRELQPLKKSETTV